MGVGKSTISDVEVAVLVFLGVSLGRGVVEADGLRVDVLVIVGLWEG